MRATTTTGAISPNEQFYFRSGVLLDLQTGKELESRRELLNAIFDDGNEAVFSVISGGRKPSKAGMMKAAGDWVLALWEADGRVLQAYPASLTRLLVIIRNSKTLRNELVLVGKDKELARIPWPEDGREGVMRVSLDRKTLALVDIPRAKVEVRNLESGKLLTTADAPWSMLSDLDVGASQFVFLNKNRSLLSCRGAIQIWDLKTGDNLVGKAYRKEARPEQLGFNEDFCDLRTLLARRTGAYLQIQQATVTPDGRHLALIELPQLIGEDLFSRNKPDRFKIHIMAIPSFKILCTEDAQGEPPHHIQFSSNSRFLIGEGPKKTTIWEIEGKVN